MINWNLPLVPLRRSSPVVRVETMTKRSLILGLVRVPVAVFIVVAVVVGLLGDDGLGVMVGTRVQALMLGGVAACVALIKVGLHVRENWHRAE